MVWHRGFLPTVMGLTVVSTWSRGHDALTGLRCQKTGVAGLLMKALIEASREAGFTTMEGAVLVANAPMLQFARALGFDIERIEGDLTTLHICRRLQPKPAPTAAA